MAEVIEPPAHMPDEVRAWIERLDTLELRQFAQWLDVTAGFAEGAWREKRGYERIEAAEREGYHLTEDDWIDAFWKDEWRGPKP